MDSTKARELAAQCWCDPTTAQLEMNPDLAEVIAIALTNAYLDGWKDAVLLVNGGTRP